MDFWAKMVPENIIDPNNKSNYLPDSGEIILMEIAAQACSIHYLPEERGLYTSMKVGEQCLYLAQMKGLSKAEATNN
jgi:ABC-type uncharacterized transport system ATPase subunit